MSGQLNFRPLYRDPYDGIQTEVPDGGIVNIGGTSNATFTVAGKGVMLADGSTSNGDPSALFNLQVAYRNSNGPNGDAAINMLAGKDFVIRSTQPGKFFKIDAETGDVVITGNLYVSGDTTVVETVVTDYDHILITPRAPDSVGFRLKYDGSTIPNASYMEVFDNRLGINVFSIDRFGSTDVLALRVQTDIQMVDGGLVDGVDVSELASLFTLHTTHSQDEKHWTDEIRLSAQMASAPEAANLQNLLEFFDSSINISNQLVSQIQTRVDELRHDVDSIEFEQALEPRGYVHVQEVTDVEWVVNHNKGTTNFTYVLFDASGRQFIPNEVIVDSPDSFRVRMNMPTSGRVNIIFFVPQPHLPTPV